jgi:hypothetical protein
MRTESVRILPYRAPMINPGTAEAMARDHQNELRRSAELDRIARRVRATRVHPLRARAGWWLVHAGIRLAVTAEPSRPTTTPTTASA